VTGFWLRYRESIDSYKLLEDLEVDPNDSDLVKAISCQLQDLEAMG